MYVCSEYACPIIKEARRASGPLRLTIDSCELPKLLWALGTKSDPSGERGSLGAISASPSRRFLTLILSSLEIHLKSDPRYCWIGFPLYSSEEVKEWNIFWTHSTLDCSWWHKKDEQSYQFRIQTWLVSSNLWTMRYTYIPTWTETTQWLI